ncbi:DUF6328 family protein [Myceligenerans salitolerans]|uniref:Sodium:proton antiporter n=1 Tax=Myceligenerans salitolerans TaxID=1230528 RepID=A0ABS3IEI2_9MICO|nr:DUF6328 family protein [Myceligenerans salitolerans]MBO0610412.1 sodium:proton antiporter [Myceligenerans salitolerans]
MAPDQNPDPDAPRPDRQETPAQRADRNWVELLQELRVLQTGVQVLTGFLLILPFQAEFESLDGYQRTVYLTLLVTSVLATALLTAPVSLHRALFRRRLKTSVVETGDRQARAALAALGLTLTGTVLFVFDVVVGRAAGIIAGGAVFLVIVALWVLVPGWLRRHADPVV